MAVPEPSATTRASAHRPPADPNVLVVLGRLHPDDGPRLCERACVILAASEVTLLVCDVGAIGRADACTLDALARLALSVQRLGRHVRLRRASPELRQLISFVGLDGVLACDDSA